MVGCISYALFVEICETTGTLNLVDLAGSERLVSNGSASERLKETQSINKSLSNLGNVIMALANQVQPTIMYGSGGLGVKEYRSIGIQLCTLN